jgi:hypothetical protein
MKQGLIMILVFFIWTIIIFAFQQLAVPMIGPKKHDPAWSAWSEWRDLNPRPSLPESDALPDCATLRFCILNFKESRAWIQGTRPIHQVGILAKTG